MSKITFTLRSVVLVLFSFTSLSGFAQDNQRTVEFSGYTWSVAAREAAVESHLGREALRLEAGRVIAEGIEFLDGVIEFDAAFGEQQSFIGAGWRLEDRFNFEEMYFRAHKYNDPDTLQYTPVYHGLSAWQLFYDQHSIAPLAHNYESWNKVKIVVDGESAEIFYNDSEQPSLHIRQLDREPISGSINLRVSGQGTGPIYFSNFSVSPLTNEDRITAEPALEIELPAGLIEEWQVSEPLGEANSENELFLTAASSGASDWQSMRVDDKGFANLAKLRPSTNEDNSVFIRATIDSETDQFKEMLFGYSDRARIYLNGKRIYNGIGGWQIRNYSYMGLVSFHDSVGLDLKSGENELLIAVSETFGGWGWGAAIADRDGIEIID